MQESSKSGSKAIESPSPVRTTARTVESAFGSRGTDPVQATKPIAPTARNPQLGNLRIDAPVTHPERELRPLLQLRHLPQHLSVLVLCDRKAAAEELEGAQGVKVDAEAVEGGAAVTDVVLERSLQVARPDAFQPETWTADLAALATFGTGS